MPPAMTSCFVIAVMASLSCDSRPLAAQVAEGRFVRTAARVSTPSTRITVRSPKVDFGGLRDATTFEVDHRNGYLTAFGSPGGGAIVLDGVRVLVFDPGGSGFKVVGRQGAGPGEFTALWRGCGFADGTAVVMDNALRRISWLSPSGSVIRSQIVPNMGAPLEHGCLDDGSVIYQAPKARARTGNTNRLWRLDATGLGRELPIVVPVEDPSAPVRSPVEIAAVGRRIMVADSRTNEIAVYSPVGELLIRVTTQDEQARLSPGLLQRNASTDSPDGLAPPTRGAAPNERMSAFAEAVLSTDGHLLVRDAPRDRVRSDYWTWHAADGRIAARVELHLDVPHRLFHILQLETSRMFIMWRDMDGAAHFGWVQRPSVLRVRGGAE